jgi:type VI secretion system secreted protein VgrG
MEIVTPLGADVLLFHRMHAREELGRLGEFHVDLLSTRGDINLDQILGKNVTIKLELQNDSTRHFNGFVTRFAQSGTHGRYHRYVAEVRPWLWFLTRTADCRIFQDMTVPDILKAVFADEPTNDFKMELTGSYRKWTYCVQYRETDFNFVSRLMEHEGIYHYVRHTEGHNTLVVTDGVSGHACAAGYEKIPFLPRQDVGRPELEHVSTWEFSREIQPGAYVHTDYDLERPSVGLKTEKTLPRTYAPSTYEVFDYPGFYVQKPDGDSYAGVRIDEYGTQFETAHAAANARGVSVGSLFSLSGCPREDQNCEHLVVAASHQLQFGEYEGLPDAQGASYGCTFTAMSSKQQFRPRRATPKPFVQGPQTAVVVGPAGDEIYTDMYGRVKVQFHWDRYGKKNENSSCWTRVSSPWAGKAWGAISTPRIGQEVIVDFLEGDPDQPIVTGRVYNAEQMPPYELPANKTQSGMKSRSSTGGSPDNFNEIRFEDEIGQEEVYVHAEKDMNRVVENNDTVKVGFSKKDKGDQTIEIFHDRTETVGNDETITIHGNRTETVDKDEKITIHMNRREKVDENEDIQIGGNRSIRVSKSEDAVVALQRTHAVGVNETIAIGGAQEVAVGGAQIIAVGLVQATTVGGNQTNDIGGDHSITVGKNTSLTVTKNETRKVGESRNTKIGKDDALEVAKKLTMIVGDSIMLKSGESSITLKKDGTVVIKGKNITLDGSGKINVKASGDVVIKGSKITQN